MRRIFFLILMLSVFPAFAGTDPEILGTFGDWTAFAHQDDKGKVCYISSQPIKSAGKYTKRDDVFLMVAHRPADKVFNEINVVAGYTYQKGGKPTFSVDNKKAVFLTTQDNTAWAKDAKADATLVAQMKAGSKGVLKGKSKRGTATTDTFSFKGFSKAYQAINEACEHQ